jgi:hypothetical protein
MSGSATASENVARRPPKSTTLEERWKLLEEYGMGNHSLLVVRI